MFKFILLDFASIFYEAPPLSRFKEVFFVSKMKSRLSVFIFLIAVLDDSLDI